MNSATTPLDFQNVFESVPGLYLVLNLDRKIVAVSDAYLQATMTVRQDIIGRDIFEVFPDNPSDLGATGVKNLASSLDKVSRFRKPDVMPVQKYDVRKPQAEGGQFEVRYWSPMNSPLINRAGKLVGIIHRVEDVTDYVRLKQNEAEHLKNHSELQTRATELESEIYLRAMELRETKAARAEAEKLGRLKDEFLATLSHELRTPLTPILGWTRLIQSGQVQPTEVAHAMQIIERNVKAQTAIVEDLLDVSRIITGRLRLDLQPVGLAQIIEGAMDAVRPTTKAKCIQIRFIMECSVGPIRGDAGRLQQVMWNLLSNAAKFTPKDGSIEIRLLRENSRAVIQVIDNGEGIEANYIGHVFDRFSQADSSTTRKHGGLGIGLSIVRHLVELHGGSVKAESAGKGMGATFTVSLPIPVSLAPLVDQSVSYPKTMITSPVIPQTLKGLRILAVDDEADSLAFVSHVLTRLGAEVSTAESVTEALRLLKTFRADLVISDIGMPVEDGYALIRKIRLSGSDIPALALTAFARAEDKDRALAEGFQHHLSKPVDPAELANCVIKLSKRSA